MVDDRQLRVPEDIAITGRVVIVAPHPDDEVFALGGAMALLEWSGIEVEVVAVTDGEASHASSTLITPWQLRQLRCEETQNAYRMLGVHPQRYRLGLPDSNVAGHSQGLKELLAARCPGAAAIFAPLETDGHPDHDACGQIAIEVSRASGVPLWRYSVWSRLNPGRIIQGTPRRISLPSEVRYRKQRAVGVYRSQLLPLGPLPQDGPVLPPDFLEHFTEPWELVWQTN